MKEKKNIQAANLDLVKLPRLTQEGNRCTMRLWLNLALKLLSIRVRKLRVSLFYKGFTISQQLKAHVIVSIYQPDY